MWQPGPGVGMNPRYRGLLPYLLVLAAAAVLTWNALHFGYTPRGDRPGPDVWPRAILALMIAACIVRIVAVLRTYDGHALFAWPSGVTAGMPLANKRMLAMAPIGSMLFTALGDDYQLNYAKKHRDVIQRFGRFPHRNQMLGRAPRPDEIAAGDITPF